MPNYVYRCEKDCIEISEFRQRGGSLPGPICDICKQEMNKIPGSPSGTIITERSPNTGRSVKRGINEELRKRSHEHFVKYEADDLIEEQGKKMASDLGWIDPKTGKKRTLIDEK